MTYQKLSLKSGIYKDDSPLEAEGYYIDSDKIRFVRGLPETIYGWENFATTTLLGMCRGAISYTDNSRNAYAAFGTHLRLYLSDVDGNITDITPIVSRINQSVSLTTTANSNVVTVNLNGHGLIVNQKIQLLSASPATIDGIAIDGTWTVLTVADPNHFTFVANQSGISGTTASSTADYYAYLAPGNQDGTGGLGYGVGAYGSGGYGNPATGVTYWPLTWCLDRWGENLIANPRNGGIYEFAPNTSTSELTANGTFAGSSAGWILGSGWSYSANAVVASSANSAFSQSVTLPVAAWCLLVVNVSAYTSGALQASLGGTNVGLVVSATGKYFFPVYTGAGGSQTLALTGSGASLTVNFVWLQVETTAQAITNAPAEVTSIMVTPERILAALGSPDTSGNFDPLLISWTDVDNNQTWSAAATNFAGSYLLSEGSRIVRGMVGNGENAVFTDTGL